MKICKTCNIEKELDKFYNNKLTKDGKTIHCIECVKQYKIDNPKTEEQKEKSRIKRSSKKRGITIEEVLLEDKLINDAKEKGLKLCYSCIESKELTEFGKHSSTKDGLLTICKVCKNKQTQEHYKNNVEHISVQKDGYRKENMDKVRVRQNRWMKNKLKTDSLFKLSVTVRSRVKQYLKVKNFKEKLNKTNYEMIGLTPQELREHIENQFTEGMSWELMGKHIHIDHIIPLASAKTYEDVIRLSHYTNLQPLWASDNMRKGTRIL
jgi:hypothetical protein